MYNDIRLFLCGTELEFSTPPQILYNYNVTDFTNPTIVKNGYSKSITVEGTPNNNILFNHIFRADRMQTGSAFNPIKRAPFELYVNGEIYEKGYAKLTSVKRSGNSVSYEIQLFGGIGSFFYSLSYFDDSDRKKTLADLVYIDDERGWSEPDMNFEINKENVSEAWSVVNTDRDENSRWHILNFAVTSEGVPDDFDSQKVMINTTNPSGNKFITKDGDYRTVVGNSVTTGSQSGFTIAEVSNELTASQTFDLRSYLLRPVVNVRRIIKACCNPEVNGGYEVDLDPHFFNDDNPYANKDAWMTLPMLRELSLEHHNASAYTAGLVSTDANWFTLNMDIPFGSVENTYEFSMTPTYTTDTTFTDFVLNLHPYHKLITDATNRWNDVKSYECNQGIIVQVFGLSATGDELYRSEAYYLGESDINPIDGTKMWNRYTYRNGSTFKYINGFFRAFNGQWKFVDYNTLKPVNLNFRMKLSGAVSRIAVYVERPRVKYIVGAAGPMKKYPNTEWYKDIKLPWTYTFQTEFHPGHFDTSEAQALHRVTGTFGLMVNGSVKILDTKYSSLFSHMLVTKEKLLGTPFTPAEFLLSYCKLFGLYFFQDPAEPSSDDVRYPRGVIHICDRDTFYKERYEDLEKAIDRSKDMVTNPVVATAKFYRFDVEGVGSMVEEKYKSTYGYAYGRQLVDTGMDFDSETNDLYDESIFKSGVMVQERNRYYSFPVSGVPVYAMDGMSYDLYKADGEDFDTKEEKYAKRVYPQRPISSAGTYFDTMPKLQCHTDDESPSDGSYVLLFYDGFRTMNTPSGQLGYNITDDLQEMALLNDGTPCWLMTPYPFDCEGRLISESRISLPYFTRDIVRGGNIIHSWNFGHPQETYVPMVFTTYGDSIYDMCWQSYIGDMYSVDSRIMTCYVRFDERPNPSMLRNFYWFDNAIWRINRIVDWNISAFEPTKCEFLKVLDENNYKLTKITPRGLVRIVMDSKIGASGGTLNGTVICQDPTNNWTFADIIPYVDGNGNSGHLEPASDYIGPLTGSGETTSFSITIPEWLGSTDRVFTIGVEDSSDNTVQFKLTQSRVDDSFKYGEFMYDGYYDVDRNGGTFTVDVSANTVWTVTSPTGWLVVDGGEHIGDDRVTFTVDYNERGERSAMLQIVFGDGTEGGTMWVRQSENYEMWTVDPRYSPILSPETGRTQFSLQLSDPSDEWRAVGSEDWIGVSPSSGIGSATVNVFVSANSGWRRGGDVNIYNGTTLKCTFGLTQAGERMDNPIKVPQSSYTVDGEYNLISIPVTDEIGDTTWAFIVASDGRDWVSLEGNRGPGSSVMQVTIQPNDTGEERDTLLREHSIYGNLDIRIIQSPREE